MKKEKRNIESERKKIIQYQSVALYLPSMAITIAYYLGAKLIFGSNNYYVGAILAGLTGGMWSLTATNGYHIYRDTKNKTEKEWYSSDAYQKRLEFCSKIVLIFFVIFIIEIFLIWFFKW